LQFLQVATYLSRSVVSRLIIFFSSSTIHVSVRKLAAAFNDNGFIIRCTNNFPVLIVINRSHLNIQGQANKTPLLEVLLNHHNRTLSYSDYLNKPSGSIYWRKMDSEKAEIFRKI
jgi:hypothetical protein